MSLDLNARKWWECYGDELWAMNLGRPNFIAQDDECHRRGGNQAVKSLLAVICHSEITINAGNTSVWSCIVNIVFNARVFKFVEHIN